MTACRFSNTDLSLLTCGTELLHFHARYIIESGSNVKGMEIIGGLLSVQWAVWSNYALAVIPRMAWHKTILLAQPWVNGNTSVFRTLMT